jgi:hypothetical protein
VHQLQMDRHILAGAILEGGLHVCADIAGDCHPDLGESIRTAANGSRVLLPAQSRKAATLTCDSEPVRLHSKHNNSMGTGATLNILAAGEPTVQRFRSTCMVYRTPDGGRETSPRLRAEPRTHRVQVAAPIGLKYKHKLLAFAVQFQS